MAMKVRRSFRHRPRRTIRRARGERGAVLVHVAVALVGLLAFSALSIDLGVLWIARGQAQNAADAAVMAGAVSLAFVDPDDTTMAADAARVTAEAHQIWGVGAGTGAHSEVEACPPGAPAGGGDCVHVHVGRGGAYGPPLPTYMARLFGVSAQVVEATAHAKVMVGNSAPCPRPWAIADRWDDNIDLIPPIDTIWTPDDRYSLPQDDYEPPRSGSTGDGFDRSLIGVELSLEPFSFANGFIFGAEFQSLDLPRTDGAGVDDDDRYRLNIQSCSGGSVAIGRAYPIMSASVGSTRDGIADLIAQDPAADWDGTVVRGSAFAISPRIVALAVYDPHTLASTAPINPGDEAVIRNIVGFFVRGFESNRIRGVVVPMSGALDQTADEVTGQSAFLRMVTLVR
jgi:Putative Flp pilus-assembly TadE/G-like